MARITTKYWTQFLLAIAPTPFKHGWGAKLTQAMFGIPADVGNDAIRDAGLTMNWSNDETPEGVTVPVGTERNFPRYPDESIGEWRTRLKDAWSRWRNSGTHTGILDELTSAGFPNAMIQRSFGAWPGNLDNGVSAISSTADYWSQFIVVIPIRSPTSETLYSPTWSEAESEGYTWDGGGLFWDAASNLISFAQITTIKSIIKLFKPADWICTAIVFLPPTTVPTYLSSSSYLTDSESLWSDRGVEFHNAT